VPEWSVDPSSQQPFVRYRRMLRSWTEADDDAWFVDRVGELDAAVAEVDGHGFLVTPCAPYTIDALPNRADTPVRSAVRRRITATIKDETDNVSGSHKARHTFGLMLHLLVRERRAGAATDRPPLAIASCGNAAVAAAVVAAAERWPITVYVPEDAEPAVVVRLQELGATVQFSHLGGGRGSSRFERSVHGRRGALDIPRDRTGGAVRLRLADRTLEGKEILGLLPGFSLNDITARLFGEDGVVYDLPDVPHAEMALDARLLAIEYHDFAEAVLQGRAPEVDGRDGMIAVAAILGAYESAAVGRAVELEELLSGAVRTYQEEIDDALGL